MTSLSSFERDYTPADRLLSRLGEGLARISRGGPASALSSGASPAASPAASATPPAALPDRYPAAPVAEAPLADEERRRVAGLMRVNHAGEVSAQGLYHGQALLARTPELRAQLLHAADEERNHLLWCEARLRELGEQPSRLREVWYAGSFALGATAALLGDRASLGFVEETERQVVEHLDEHLGKLPPQDRRTRAIIRAMKADEARHGSEAAAAGARPMPAPVRGLMRGTAKLMKLLAYRF